MVKKKKEDITGQSVAASDYTALKAASSGVPVNAEWRDGKVSVGGILIKPDSVTDGKAVVSADRVNEAVDSLKKSMGLQSNQDIIEKYNQKYGDMYDEQLEKLRNREEFSYHAEDDPVYQSYKQQYNREGKRATEDTAGIYSALTGGMGNSSAVTAAAQTGQYWNDKLMDVIPQLAGDAYDRYVKEFELDRQALADILDVDSHLFEREYNANRDTISDMRDAQDYAYQRDRDTAQMNYEKEKDIADRQEEHDQWNANLADSSEKWKAQLAAQTKQEDWDNALKLYQTSGEIPNDAVAQILGIPAGTVTAEMKKLMQQLAQERILAEEKYAQEEKMTGIKHGNDTELENLKHKHTIQEIQAKK